MISIHDTLVDAGLDVADVRVPGYRGRGLRGIAGVLVHHNAVPGGMRTFWSAVEQSSKTATHLPPPHYHVMVAPTGQVASLTDQMAIHAGKGRWDGPPGGVSGNSNLVGICGHNSGTGEVWPVAQVWAMADAAAAICVAAGLTAEHVRAHREWAQGRKIDPAGRWSDGQSWDEMAIFRRLVDDRIRETDNGDDDMTPDQARKLDELHSALVGQLADKFPNGAPHDIATSIQNTRALVLQVLEVVNELDDGVSINLDRLADAIVEKIAGRLAT